MAATADQAAFILSIPRRKLMDETQETLRTSAFPSTHVKVQSFNAFKEFHMLYIHCFSGNFVTSTVRLVRVIVHFGNLRLVISHLKSKI